MKKFKLIPLLVLAAVACSKTETDVHEDALDQEFADVLVPDYRVPVYVDLDQYTFNAVTDAATRAKSSYTSLSKLLQKSKRERMVVNNTVFVQTPFKDDGAKARIARERTSEDGSYTKVRKYLINRTYKGKTIDFVATMIPTPEYERQSPDFTFNYRPNYSGYIIFSKISGRAFVLRRYSNGRIVQAHFLKDESEAQEYGNVMYLFFPSETAKTRSAEPFPGDPGVCVEDFDWEAYWENIRKKYETTDDNWWENYNDADDTDDHDSGEGGGGGGNGDSGSDNGTLEGEFTLSLACSAPEAVILTGGGKYRKGDKVTVGYQYTENVTVPLEPKFKRWSGDLKGKSKPPFSFTYTVERDMEAFAFYDWDGMPCITKDGNTNPLSEMYIAPCYNSEYNYTNWIGGTFGETRANSDGSGKRHEGLDLAADEGTEIYSMFDGVIESIYDTAKGGEKGQGDNRGLGNDIRIRVTLPNGTSILVVYAHLQQGNPIADNPMTGETFKVGDTVYAGQVVCYSGITGNAYNVAHPHVHLGIKNKSGQWVDPKTYINGTYNVNRLSNNNGKITGISCN